MKLKTLVVAAAALVSTQLLAAQYNHGNHSDPQHTFGTNSVSTFSCGSLPLTSCISQINLEAMTKQACRDKVNDDTDPFISTNGYYHHVQQYAVSLQQVHSVNPGSIEVKYSCSGYLHPGIKLSPGFQ